MNHSKRDTITSTDADAEHPSITSQFLPKEWTQNGRTQEVSVSSDRRKVLPKTRLMRGNSSPSAFLKLQQDAADWPCLFKPPCIASGRAFYRALEGETYVDDSFVITRGDALCLIAACNVNGDVLGSYGHALELRILPSSSFQEIRQDVTQAFSELQRIATARNAAKIKLRTCSSNDPYGIVASRALAANAVANVETRAEIDLALSEDEICADMRASYRRHLKWGRENLTIESITGDAADRASFDRYRMFHAEVAGRITSSLASWEAMFSWIQEGHGELLLATMGDKLVAGNVSVDALGTAYYLSGVYHRSYFQYPISHFLVYSMILRAKLRGMRFFDVGYVPAPNDEVSDKLRAIGHFKHGFTNRTVSSTIWTITK